MSENGRNALQPMEILNLGQLLNLVTNVTKVKIIRLKNYINHLSLMHMPLFLIIYIYIYISLLHPRYKYNNQMLSRLSSCTHSLCINFNHDYASWVLQKMDSMNIQPGAIKIWRYSLSEENSKQKSEKIESTSGKTKIPTASLAHTRGRYSLKQWMN